MSTAAESELNVYQLEDENTGSEPLVRYFSMGHTVIHDPDEYGMTSVSTQLDYLIKNEKTLQKISKEFDIPTSEIGTRIGQFVAGGIYLTTYPITFVDGPLPVVDLAWAYGGVKAVRVGGTIGGMVGGLVGLD